MSWWHQVKEAMQYFLPLGGVLGGATLVLCIILPWAWWLVRLLPCWRPRAVATAVLAGFGEMLDRGGPAGHSLLRLATSLPLPWCLRARQVAAKASAGAPLPDLIGECADWGLLPARVARLARAAVSLGPDVAGRWLARAGTMPVLPARTLRLAVLMVGILAALGFIMTFMVIFMFPKFEQIFRELGATLPPLVVTLTEFARSVGPFAIPLAILASITPPLVWSLIELWRWRAVERWLLMHLVGEAVRAGVTEAALAHSLAPLRPAQASRLQSAGDAGDLPRLTGLLGLGRLTPAVIPARLARVGRLAAWRTSLMATLIELVLPLLTALVVGILVIAVWQALISLIIVLNAVLEYPS